MLKQQARLLTAIAVSLDLLIILASFFNGLFICAGPTW